MKLKKGDKVIVIAGKDRLRVGTVERVITAKNRVVVSGVNIVKKHLKKTAQNPQAGIVDKTLPIHISNVMLLDPKEDKPTRVGYKAQGDEKVRVAKRSGEAIKLEKK